MYDSCIAVKNPGLSVRSVQDGGIGCEDHTWENIHIMIMRVNIIIIIPECIVQTGHINRENFIEIFQIYKFMMFGKSILTVQTEDVLNFQCIAWSQCRKQVKDKLMLRLKEQ